MRAPAPMSTVAAPIGDVPVADPALDAAPRADRRWPRPNAIVSASMLAGAVLLVVRHPDLFTRPTLWAEDGNLLMHDALLGSAAHTITRPYNGTFIVFQRLAAELVTALPVRFTPVAYSAIALLTALLASSLILRDAVAWMIPPRPARVMAFAALLVATGTGEILGNLVNTVWYGALALLILSLSGDPERESGRTLELAGVILAGLSGPSVVLLIPLFWLRFWRTRTRHSRVVGMVATVVGGVQVACLTFVTNPAAGGRQQPAGLHHLAPGRDVSVMTERVGGGLLFGERHLASLWTGGHHGVFWIGSAMGIVAIVAACLLAPRRARFPLLLGFAATCASMVLVSNGDLVILAPPVQAGRYVFLPVCVGMIAVAAALARLGSQGRRATAVAVVVPMVVAAMGVANDLHLPAQPDIGWSRSAACIAAHRACHVPINPSPWHTDLPPLPSVH